MKTKLTPDEAKSIIEGRVYIPVKEDWRRFTKAWQNSTIFKVRVISSLIFFISLVLFIFFGLFIIKERTQETYNFYALGNHTVSLDWPNIKLDGKLLSNVNANTPLEIWLFYYDLLVFLVSGTLFGILKFVNRKHHFDVSNIIGEKSAREMAYECWQKTDELPPVKEKKIKGV
jgi:hypothetical protein